MAAGGPSSGIEIATPEPKTEATPVTGNAKRYIMAHLVVLAGGGGVLRFFPFWHGMRLLNWTVGALYLCAAAAGVVYLRRSGVAWLLPAAVDMGSAGLHSRGQEVAMGLCYSFLVIVPIVTFMLTTEGVLVLSKRTLNLLDAATAVVALAVSLLALRRATPGGRTGGDP